MLGTSHPIFLTIFLDSASLKMVNINFSSTPRHCSRKYNEMKNDFLSMTRPFSAKMLMSAGFLAGHIPCSLNAKDAKF